MVCGSRRKPNPTTGALWDRPFSATRGLVPQVFGRRVAHHFIVSSADLSEGVCTSRRATLLIQNRSQREPFLVYTAHRQDKRQDGFTTSVRFVVCCLYEKLALNSGLVELFRINA